MPLPLVLNGSYVSTEPAVVDGFSRVGRRCVGQCCLLLLFLCLLWATSLSVAVFIAQSYLNHPTLQSVMDSWRSTLNVTANESDDYLLCVSICSTQCDQQYNVSLTQLVQQQQDVIMYNSNVSDEAIQSSSDCTSTSAALVSNIQEWIQAGMILRYNSQSVCSDIELSSVKLLIGDNTAAESASSSTNNAYVSNISGLLSAASSSITQLNDYNDEYVNNLTDSITLDLSSLAAVYSMFPVTVLPTILNSIDNDVNELMQCVYGDGVENSLCPDGSLPVVFQPIYDQLTITLDAAQTALTDSLAQAATYSQMVVQLLSACVSFFSDLSVFTAVLDDLGVNLGLPSLPSPLPVFEYVGDLSLAEASLFIDRVSVTLGNAFVPTEAAFRQIVNNMKSSVLSAAIQLSNELQGITASLPSLVTSYEPPPVNLQIRSIAAQLSAFSSTFISESSADVKAFSLSSSINDSVMSSNASVEADLSGISTPSYPSPRCNFSMNAAPFSGSFPIQEIINSLGGFFAFAVLIDYSYRGYTSLSIILKVWKKPTQTLPLVDARLHQIDQLQSAHSLVTYFLTHPVVLYAAVGVIVCLSVYPLCLLYVLLYSSYVSGCVSSLDGTLLTVNSFALLYNVASLSGHAATIAVYSAYDMRAAADCARWSAAGMSSVLHSELVVQLSESQQRKQRDQIDLITRCVSNNSFNGSLSLPNPFTALSASSCPSSSSASMNYSSLLEFPRFNCSSLPSCSCSSLCSDGPSSQSILAATFNSGCSTEYAIHSTLLFCAVVLLIYICQNISRCLLVHGLIRWGWRWLSPGLMFVCYAQEDGRLDKDSAQYLQDKAKNAVKSYASQCLYYFVFGLAAHLPYFVVIFMIGYEKAEIPEPQTQ